MASIRVATALACMLACAIPLAQAALPARQRGECAANMNDISNFFPPSTQAISSTTATVEGTQYTQVTFANHFEVKYYGTFKVLTNFRAGETYVLYQCGTPKPNVTTPAKFFEIPLRAVQTDDTSVVGFMNLLDVEARIAFTSQYAVDSCQQKLASVCNKKTDDAVAAQAADSDATFGFGASPNNKSVTFQATSDSGPLARAEWVKAMATFFNAEMQANTIFNEISASYTNLRTLVASSINIPEGVVTINPPAPQLKGLWLYRLPAYSYAGFSSPVTWYIEYNVPYKSDYLKDAGATLFTADGLLANVAAVDPSYLSLIVNNVAGGKLSINNTAIGGTDTDLGNMDILGRIMRAMLKDVDVVVDTSLYDGYDIVSGSSMPAQDITMSVFMTNWGLSEDASDGVNLPFLRESRILRTDASMRADGSATDWFERAVSRPDLVLRDFVAAIRPQALDPTATTTPASYVPTFVRRLSQPLTTLHSVDKCANLVGCQMMAAPICPLAWKDCSGKLVFATATQRCPADICAPQNLASSSSAYTTPIATVIAITIAIIAMVL